MFNCYNHGWSHLEKLCPQCFPVHYTTSDSTALMETRIDQLGSFVRERDELIKLLKAENSRYREALEFYANTGNWSFASSGDYAYHETLEDDATFFNNKTSGYYAGRRAREALKGGKHE